MVAQRAIRLFSSLSIVFLFLLQIPACGDRVQEVAVLETDAGVIVIRFFNDEAPRHAINFKALAKEGFFDGTYFQKIVPGDFIQGGDPNTKDDNPLNDGSGGPGYTLEPEPNRIRHRRGIVSMAGGRSLNSSGSQFFICLRDLPHLDGLFTVFGEVVSGMDVVEEISAVPVDSAGHPNERVYLRKVSIESRPIDSGVTEESQ